jgi:uncharacterized protein
MSLLALVGTAAALGLLGGVHCIAMCSAAQRFAIHPPGPGAAGQRTADPRAIALRSVEVTRSGSGTLALAGRPFAAALATDLTFHASRLLGYAMLGALVGGGSSLLRWGAEGIPLMRPLWGSANAALLALGLALLVLGRQPRWLDALGQRIWHASRAMAPAALGAGAGAGAGAGSGSGAGSTAGSLLGATGRPAMLGLAWALLPCGLLYSALAVAVLASDPVGGAAAMLAFGAGTAVNLMGARLAIDGIASRLADRLPAIERAGVRIGGGLIAAMALAALVALALGQPHPFCID